MKRKLTNQGKAVISAAIAVVLYLIPIGVLVAFKWDSVLKSPHAALSLFSVTVLLFVFFFLKKVVKTLCKLLTPVGFGSLVVLLVSLAINSYLNDLTIIATASVIGSVLAWYPYQLAAVYSRYSRDEHGDVIKAAGMDFKTANDKLFQISISVKETESDE